MESNITQNDEIVLNLILNPGTPWEKEEKTKSEPQKQALDSETLAEVKSLEKQGVLLAEKGQLEEALVLLNQAVSILPDRASGYNNRAQLMRLMNRTDDAMNDLEMAIKLCEGKGTVASFALTQKATILKMQGKDEESYEIFKEAASLGNSFAKKQVVQFNPYAALCNRMLSQAFKDLSAANN